MKGYEFMFIVFVFIFMIIGGMLCGIEEEVVVFYFVFVLIFIVFGYDFIVLVGVIFLVSFVGSIFLIINLFLVVIVFNVVGIIFIDGFYWRIGVCIIGVIFVISYLFWYCKKIKKDFKFFYFYEDKVVFEK